MIYTDFNTLWFPERSSLRRPGEEKPGDGPLPLAVSHVEPTGAVALAAGELAVLARAIAGGARLPIERVGGTADYAGAALADSDLRALPAYHFCRVGDGPATRAYGNRLRF